MNSLRNTPIIMENKRIGLLSGMIFDLRDKRAKDIVAACGLRGKRRIDCQHIMTLADGFILVDDTTRSRLQLNCSKKVFAFDTSGVLIGCISDYAIDESSMRIIAVEVTTGYYPGKYMRRIWVFDFEYINSEEILLPASIGYELMDLKKGENMCVWQQ